MSGGRNSRQLTRQLEVVDGQRHSTSGIVARGDRDVPSQIEIDTRLHLGIQHSADSAHVARNGSIALCGGISSKRRAEVVACRSPVAAVYRVVHLNGETCGIVALAILLDIVADVQVLDILNTSVQEVRVDIDTTCAVSHSGRDATNGTVAAVVLSKVPQTILGIRRQTGATSIHGLIQSNSIGPQRTGSRGLAVDAPRCGQCSIGSSTHQIEILLSRELIGIQLDSREGHHLCLCVSHLDGSREIVGVVLGSNCIGTLCAIALKDVVSIERTTISQCIYEVSRSIHLFAVLVEANSLIAHGNCRVVDNIGEVLQCLRGVSTHGCSISIAHGSRMRIDGSRVYAEDETILHAGCHIG